MPQSDVMQLAREIRQGDRRALATALNLLDNSLAAQQARASLLLAELCSSGIPASNRLIGMTGPPGVGKSSLTAALIAVWRQRGLSVGVLAVDPSSPISGGALLGDRLRMQQPIADDNVFIRSLSSRGEFGGLSTEVWPMALTMLCAFDVVLVETVGVGQREVDVAMRCDTTCFVAQPGSGDSIQFLKAGILEVPHILVVNKHDMGVHAERTLSELAGALAGEHPEGGWTVPVLATSATERTGIEALADALEQHHTSLMQRSVVESRRAQHQAHWIIKRLAHEFGSAGIARLGGEQHLLTTLRSQDGDPFTQYMHCRQQLEAGPANQQHR